MTRLLIIGLDGATFDLIEPWVAEGDLPNLRRLMGEGVWGRLCSVVPALTYPAWTSFASGMLPGNTGIYEFYHRDAASYREQMYRSHDVPSPTLWEILNHHGMAVGLIGFPNTYPARPLKGFVISGIVSPGSHAEGFCYPADLFERHGLDRSRYRIEGRPLRDIGDDYAGYLAELKTMITQRRRVALTLMERERWDCLVLHEIATDAASHAFWRFIDPRSPCFVPDAPAICRDGLREVYRVADAMLGDLMAAAGSGALTVVLSDHGNGPTTRAINLNVLLKETGVLATKNGLFRVLIEDYVAPRFPKRLRPLLREIGAAWGALPPVIRRPLDWVFERVVEAIPRVGPRVAGLERVAVDFARTRAYAFGNRGGIYVNRRGREPQGIVPEAEYESVRRAVLDALLALTDAAGKGIFPRACLREAVYQGLRAHAGPDVLASATDEEGYFFNSAVLEGPVLDAVRPHCSGMHTAEGILLMHGPGVKQGALVTGARIVDVVPSILHALGLPVPPGLDGRVLEEALAFSRPVTFWSAADATQAPVAAPSKAEEAILHQRLRDLGYLD